MPTSQDRFPLQAFLERLDQVFAQQRGPEVARLVLDEGVRRATELGDEPALLTLRNEQAGFFRSIGAHEEALEAADAALALVSALGLEGTDAETTTLINAATAQRAAGRAADARETYTRALEGARRQFGPDDRRLAALHNNLSLALADAGDHDEAAAQQQQALAILTRATTDPDADVDIAMTLTNLAHAHSARGDAEGAGEHSQRAIDHFRAAGAEDDPHLAAALAARAATLIAAGDASGAVDHYQDALRIVERAYGPQSDAAAVTRDNLDQARRLRDEFPAPPSAPSPAPAADSDPQGDPETRATPASARRPHVPGLLLARRYWEQHGRPMLEAQFPDVAGRVAAGLVGHGSECYGFDDEASADHDFGAGFCLWLTAEDHAAFGSDLQAAYEKLPATFEGYPVRPALAAHGQRRTGVFEIGDFFESITGLRAAPRADEPHLWLSLDEATLSAATNGEVFADPHGAFGAVRGGFQRMPRDVWLTHLSRRLGLLAQAGQYNVPRMLARGEGEAAWLAVSEFVRAAASTVFLLNQPAQVGYVPYYKWQFAALRRLADRPLSRLPHVHGELTTVLRLASAACLGGAAFGEGGKGATTAAPRLTESIETVCAAIAQELRTQRLSSSTATFLEDHRPHLTAAITDPWLAQQ